MFSELEYFVANNKGLNAYSFEKGINKIGAKQNESSFF